MKGSFLIIMSPFVFVVFWLLIIINLRKVVPINEVHIVVKKRKAVPYGRESGNGNVYISFPQWFPFYGIKVSRFPLSFFDIKFENEEFCDIDHIPFLVEVTAFLVIKDPIKISQTTKMFGEELISQLRTEISFEIRNVLGKYKLREIMEGRSEMSKEFYDQVSKRVSIWGFQLNSVEFMDIKDAKGTKAVERIMAKKKIVIESRAKIKIAEEQYYAEQEEKFKETQGKKNL